MMSAGLCKDVGISRTAALPTQWPPKSQDNRERFEREWGTRVRDPGRNRVNQRIKMSHSHTNLPPDQWIVHDIAA